MNISAISSATSATAYSSVTATTIALLQKQIQTVQRQISAEQLSKTDDVQAKAETLQHMDDFDGAGALVRPLLFPEEASGSD